jgi:hypothetical protein
MVILTVCLNGIFLHKQKFKNWFIKLVKGVSIFIRHSLWYIKKSTLGVQRMHLTFLTNFLEIWYGSGFQTVVDQA